MASNSSVQVQVMVKGSPASGVSVTLMKRGGGEYGKETTDRNGWVTFTGVPTHADLYATSSKGATVRDFRAGGTGIINKK